MGWIWGLCRGFCCGFWVDFGVLGFFGIGFGFCFFVVWLLGWCLVSRLVVVHAVHMVGPSCLLMFLSLYSPEGLGLGAMPLECGAVRFSASTLRYGGLLLGPTMSDSRSSSIEKLPQ